MKIRIFSNKRNDSVLIEKELIELLSNTDIKVVDDTSFDIGISIGGDGTFLHMISKCDFDYNKKYIGINNGKLGFLTEVMPSEIEKLVTVLKNNSYNVRLLDCIDTTVKTPGRDHHFKSLNEVVVRVTDFKTALLDVNIDDVLLENFSGDGVMVSTQTGSTAYNMSALGPLIHPDLKTLVFTPLAPINNHIYSTLTNSMCLPITTEFKFIPTKRSNLTVIIDGMPRTVDRVEEVSVKLSNDKLNVITLNKYDYIKTVKEKFIK